MQGTLNKTESSTMSTMTEKKFGEDEVQVSNRFKKTAEKFRNSAGIPFVGWIYDDFILFVKNEKFQCYFCIAMSLITLLFISGFFYHTRQELGIEIWHVQDAQNAEDILGQRINPVV
jgi:hypothetical protein